MLERDAEQGASEDDLLGQRGLQWDTGGEFNGCAPAIVRGHAFVDEVPARGRGATRDDHTHRERGPRADTPTQPGAGGVAVESEIRPRDSRPACDHRGGCGTAEVRGEASARGKEALGDGRAERDQAHRPLHPRGTHPELVRVASSHSVEVMPKRTAESAPRCSLAGIVTMRSRCMPMRSATRTDAAFSA